MMPKLTDEQRQAVQQQETPPRLLDEQSNTVYVLLREDMYEQVKAFFEDDEIDPRELYPLMWEVMREDWEDPAMDVYDNHPEPKSS